MKTKTKIVLSRQINYVIEGYHLLQSVAEYQKPKQQYDYEEIKEYLLRKYQIPSEKMDKNTEFELKLVRRATAVLQEDLPQIEKYFAFDTDIPSTAYLVCCLNMLLLGGDGRDNGAGVIADYWEMSEWQRDYCFLQSINDSCNEEEEILKVLGDEKKGTVLSTAERIRNLLSCIQKMDLSAEKKNLLQDAYLNRDTYLVEMAGLLDKAIAVLKEQETELLRITEEWEQYWSNYLDSPEVTGMIDGMLGQMELEEVWIFPGIMRGAWLQVSVDGGLRLSIKQRGVPAAWHLGILLDVSFLKQNESEMNDAYKPEEYQKILKLLADKSKFDILLFIKETPAYGAEIAQHFGLTTATVSHHMNQLVSNRLVEAKFREKRIYYQTKKDVVQEIFESCRAMFD